MLFCSRPEKFGEDVGENTIRFSAFSGLLSPKTKEESVKMVYQSEDVKGDADISRGKFVPLLKRGEVLRKLCDISDKKFSDYCKDLNSKVYNDSVDFDFNEKWIRVSDVVNCLKELDNKLNLMACDGSMCIAKTEFLKGQKKGELMMIGKCRKLIKRFFGEVKL